VWFFPLTFTTQACASPRRGSFQEKQPSAYIRATSEVTWLRDHVAKHERACLIFYHLHGFRIILFGMYTRTLFRKLSENDDTTTRITLNISFFQVQSSVLSSVSTITQKFLIKQPVKRLKSRHCARLENCCQESWLLGFVVFANNTLHCIVYEIPIPSALLQPRCFLEVKF